MTSLTKVAVRFVQGVVYAIATILTLLFALHMFFTPRPAAAQEITVTVQDYSNNRITQPWEFRRIEAFLRKQGVPEQQIGNRTWGLIAKRDGWLRYCATRLSEHVLPDVVAHMRLQEALPPRCLQLWYFHQENPTAVKPTWLVDYERFQEIWRARMHESPVYYQQQLGGRK